MAYRHKRSKPTGGFRQVRIARPSYLKKFDFSKDIRYMKNIPQRGFLNFENKFVDVSYAGNIPAVTGQTGGEADPATGQLNAVAQGDGESDRDGRKYTMNSIYVEGFVDRPANSFSPAGIANGSAINCFVALVWDKQTNGAQLNSEDVFKNPGAALDRSGLPLRNLKFVKRFEVLKIKKMVLYPTGIGTDGTTIFAGGSRKCFKIYKSLKIPVLCTDTGNTVADVMDNSLHMIAFASSQTNVLELEYNSRIRFTG